MALAYKHEKYTYDDYRKLPDQPRMELIHGELLVCPAPNIRHQGLLGLLYVKLRNWVIQRRLGEVLLAPTDVVLSEFDVVQPDLLFVAKERLEIIGELNVQAAPDLAVEIASPSHQARDKVLKKSVYEEFGVREYWIVDPEQESIAVMSLGKGKFHVRKYARGAVLQSKVLRRFKLNISDLFAELSKRYKFRQQGCRGS